MPSTDALSNLRIASPCSVKWSEMTGDERVRHCSLCQLNVYNLREMKRDEIRELLIQKEGRVCVQMHQRADGTLLTRDCPRGVRALRIRFAKIAAAVIATFLNFSAAAFGQSSCEKPDRKAARIELQRDTVQGQRKASISGVVVGMEGGPIPGVTVTLRDERGKEVAITSGLDGTFRFDTLKAGAYDLTLQSPGLVPAYDRIELRKTDSVQVHVAMPVTEENIIIVTGGSPVIEELPDSSVSIMFNSRDVERLP